MTMTPFGAGVFASTLTGIDRPRRLDDLEAPCRELTERHPRHLVRTITYRYGPRYFQTGTVTGIVIGVTGVGDVVEGKAEGRMFDGLRVMLCGAGCVFPKPHLIPKGSVIEAITA